MITGEEYNILTIDENIRKRFHEELNTLDTLKTRLKDIIISLEEYNKRDNLVKRGLNSIKLSLDVERVNLTTKIDKIENKKDYDLYTFKTINLLERYRKILNTPIKISFFSNKRNEDTILTEKKEIIKEYLALVESLGLYHHINRIDKKKVLEEFENCLGCGNSFEFEMQDNFRICMDCGLREEILTFSSSYKDVDRISCISTKYMYDRKVHFRDTINQYQGKQNCTIDSSVFVLLEEKFKDHALLLPEDGTKFGRFKKITRNHVSRFLRELGLGKHYENITLIHHIMTGQKPPDISHLEEKLIQDFDLLIQKYDELFKNKIKRTNFISSQYVLFQLLKRHKFPCDSNDFVMLKTIDRKNTHDDITRTLFAELGFNFSCT